MRQLCCILLTACLMVCSGFSSKAEALPAEERFVPDYTNAERVALVIGNAKYSMHSLKSPVKDALDMAAVLKTLGFQVEAKTDLTRQEMHDAIEEFGNKLKKNSSNTVGLFYYSGHGSSVEKSNYLLPINADDYCEKRVKQEAVRADYVIEVMKDADNLANFMILDSCRSKPTTCEKSGDKGLSKMDVPKDTLILYAAAPGGIAKDGGHDLPNSPFTLS